MHQIFIGIINFQCRNNNQFVFRWYNSLFETNIMSYFGTNSGRVNPSTAGAIPPIILFIIIIIIINILNTRLWTCWKLNLASISEI